MICGIYINIIQGKILNYLNHDQIYIGYEKELADMGMNPITAFRFKKEFAKIMSRSKVGGDVESALNQKEYEDKYISTDDLIEYLPVKIWRSSYDQAFLAEYVCPNISEATATAYEDMPISEICRNTIKILDGEIDDHVSTLRHHEFDIRKGLKGYKTAKIEDSSVYNHLDFVQNMQTIEDLNKRLLEVVNINLENSQEAQ